MGYSNGGGMSYHLACNATDLIAAAAPAAFDLVEEMSCNPSRPISVYSYRGRYDFIVPYSGGESTPPTGYDLDPITFFGAEDTFQAWGALNSCSGSSTTSGYPSSCKGFKSCAAGSEVVLCTARFGGHSGWDATQAWNFLKTKTLP
jgi:polyhydroxybutyrate depolymerase